MFPGFHAAQYLLLPLWRHAVEPLQALLVLALRFARQTPERRIVFKCLLTLLRRHLPLSVQPLTRVMSLRRRLKRTISRLRSRLEIRPRLTVVLRIRRRTVELRTRLATLFPARLPILLPGLLNARVRHIPLLIAPILREQWRNGQGQQQTCPATPLANFPSRRHLQSPETYISRVPALRRVAPHPLVYGFAFTSC